MKYYTGDKLKTNETGGACSMYGREKGAYRILVGKSERKRPLGRPRLWWEGNIKMDLREEEWGAWTVLIWLRIGPCAGHL